jgi:hypothetical protein
MDQTDKPAQAHAESANILSSDADAIAQPTISCMRNSLLGETG